MFSAGVIDQDYRGNVGVVTFNFNDQDFTVSKGDRIAQLILERIYIPELEELKVNSHFHTCLYCDVPGSPCLSKTGPVYGPFLLLNFWGVLLG